MQLLEAEHYRRLGTKAAKQDSEKTLKFFNEASLTSGARDELDRNARCLEARAKLAVRLEGHADERGSTDYNLSLAQRRAESVRNYLVSLGVESDRLATLSYGEERPASSGHDERAWAENRRVEFSTR